MRRTHKNLFAAAAALLVFAAVFVVCQTVLFGANFVELIVQLDHPDRFQIYYTGSGAFSEQHSVSSGMIEPNQLQTVRINLHNVPARKLRIDLGDKPGTVRLHKLTVAGTYAGERVLWPEDIQRLFSPQAADATVRSQKEYAEIQSGEDSYLTHDTSLLKPNPLLLWGLPLLFALLAFSLLSQTEISGLAPFSDLYSKQPSIGENINALDGLRGLAMLMVIADHTWGLFTGLGASGVWIFMTLSGFLLAKPFVQQPERALSVANWQHFFARRLRRILPLYYTYIVIVYLFTARFDEALLHLLFLKGAGHLWVVPQEMFFYLLTPLLMLVSLLLFRLRPWLVLPALIALMLLSNHSLDGNVLFLYGMNNIKLRPYVGVFLAGIIASWLYYGIWQSRDRSELHKKIEPWGAGISTALLLLFLLGSEEHLWGTGKRIFTQMYFSWFGTAAAVLILAVLAAGPASAITRILSSLPLRALSLVSFSIYLFHPMMLELIRKGAAYYGGINHLSGLPLFVSTLLLSYLFACLTYTLIERPFLRSA
jgi:peptidoglycan/LPS O-acetylase OafA/YrhL